MRRVLMRVLGHHPDRTLAALSGILARSGHGAIEGLLTRLLTTLSLQERSENRSGSPVRIVDDDPLGGLRPRQAVDPPTVSSRPIAPVGSLGLGAPATCPSDGDTAADLHGIIPRPTQVANGFLGQRRRPDLVSTPARNSSAEFARVATIGFDPLTGFPRNERRRNRLTGHPRYCHLALQGVAARPRFVNTRSRSSFRTRRGTAFGSLATCQVTGALPTSRRRGPSCARPPQRT